MTLVSQHGFDVLQGVGIDRDASKAEEAVIVHAGTSIHPVVDETDTFTLKIDNNAVASAAIVIDLYFALHA